MPVLIKMDRSKDLVFARVVRVCSDSLKIDE